MTPCCPQSTRSCCCLSLNYSACGYGTLTCSPDLLPCSGPAVFDFLSSTPALSNSEWSAMKSQLVFTHEMLTCCTLYNHCEQCWSSMNVWTSWSCTVISTRHSHKRTGHPSEHGSSLGFFLGSCLSREFFQATVLLHLHCLLFGVLGCVSV